jgi:dTDP-4-amino-4,6-dideoxygalactose transaminase
VTEVLEKKENKLYAKWPCFEQDEIDAVERVLRSGNVNFWTGEYCRTFEASFAKRMGAEYGIAVANGTLALELALRAMGLERDDEVIVPARTFIATASSVAICGGSPVVVDIDELSQNITAETIAPAITSKTKAIIVVHLAGSPCDMDPIMKLARQHDLVVIEDCAQAHGAEYKGRPVGSIGDFAAYSFCQDKIMTTGGEGGMLLTSNPEYFRLAQSFKDHGKNFEKMQLSGSTQQTYAWLHDSFGSNFRMTEMQAAIGLQQLAKLDQWLEKRDQLADIYTRIISQLNEVARVILPQSTAENRHAYYKYCLQIIHPQFTAAVRDQVIFSLRERGIPIFMGFSPDISLERAFNETQKAHPVASLTADRHLMLLCHPTLTIEAVEEIAHNVVEVIKQVL